jgi:hypothetical protein
MNNRIKKVGLLVIAASLGLMSCIPTTTKINAFPKMYEEKPNVILVLPPINESTAAEAQDYYATTIAEPLSDAGFYVLPIEVLHDILKSEGLYDTEMFDDLPVEKFYEYFAADAVLLTRILKWDTSYYVIGGNVTVSIDFKLVSTSTGEVLWKYNGTIVVDTTGDSGNAGGVAGLLILAATTAINTATTDYVPQAKKANIQALTTIPVGRYHSRHQKDQNDNVVEENTTKKVR